MLIYLLLYAITRIFVSHTKDTGFKLRKFWIKSMGYPILNIHDEVKGNPINKPALYVANHRSFADPVVMSKYLDAFIIAKAEVANYPIINKGAEVTGIIYVKREDKTSRNTARKAFVDVIENGFNVLVYPEGTVCIDKHPLSFKKGTFYEAVKHNIPVVPVAIEFKDKKDLWMIPNFVSQYLHQFGFWKTSVKLAFGPEMEADDGDILREKCYSWIDSQLLEMQENWLSFNHSDLKSN